MLAKGKERLPGCGLRGRLLCLADDVEGGGEATPASCYDALGARKRRLKAWGRWWDVAGGSGSGAMLVAQVLLSANEGEAAVLFMGALGSSTGICNGGRGGWQVWQR